MTKYELEHGLFPCYYCGWSVQTKATHLTSSPIYVRMNAQTVSHRECWNRNNLPCVSEKCVKTWTTCKECEYALVLQKTEV